MSEFTISPTTPEHIEHLLSAGLRAEDAREVVRATGRSVEEALKDSVRLSTFCYTGFFDGVPALLFGVADSQILPREGVIWLLGTDEITCNWRSFVRASYRYISFFKDRYTRLWNLADVEHIASLRWLQALGFNVATESVPHGPEGHPFVYFEWRLQ